MERKNGLPPVHPGEIIKDLPPPDIRRPLGCR